MNPTRDHKAIQQWALRHYAIPAQIQVIKHDGEPAVLTFIIGEAEVARPQIIPISWESFFAQFDLLKLSIALDQETPNFDIVRVEKSHSGEMAD